MRTTITFILACALIMLLSCGCSAAMTTITEDSPTLAGEGVSVTFSPYDIEGEMEVAVDQIDPPSLDFDEEITEDYQVAVYDITTDHSEFTDLIEIEMAYDESFMDADANEATSVFAMYYNEESKQWETVDYTVDTENNKVIVTTNHLSPYGVFTVKNENTRLAYIGKVNSYANIVDSAKAQEILNAAIANPTGENQVAVDVGMGVMNDWLGLSSFLLTTSSPIYSTELLAGISSAFNGLGVAAAIAQVAVDFQSGNNVALYGNLSKNILNIAVANWGTSALQLSFAGVFAIDYSLNKFATAAWDGRNDIWYDAYNLHYKEKMNLTDRQWYSKFYWLWQDSLEQKDPNYLKEKIAEAIEQNVNSFWQDELEMAAYQEQVMSNASTGGGGLNEGLKKEITDAKRTELINRLQPVFNQLEKRIGWYLRDQYRLELEKAKKEFNKVINVTIEEVVPDGAQALFNGYTVKFAPLSDDAVEKTWTGKLNSSGQAKTKFTLLGHMQSGSPNTIELYPPDANLETDAPEKVIQFRVDGTELVIKIGNFPPLEELVGAWPGNFYFESVIVPDPESYSTDNGETEDAEDALAGCEGFDIDMGVILAAIKEMEGQSQPTGLYISKTGENTGCLWFSEDSTEQVDEDQKFYFNYDNGQIKINKSDAGFDITLELRASYIDDTKIKIEGPINMSGMDGALDIDIQFTSER